MVNMNPDTWKAPPTVEAFHISFSISLAAMVTISAVSQQHIELAIPHRPPIPPRSHIRAQKHHTKTRTCARTHFLFAPSLSRSLSHIPTVLPPSSTPSRAFPPPSPPHPLVPGGLGEQDIFWGFPCLPVSEREGGRGAETMGSALIYGASFDGVSHLPSINRELQLWRMGVCVCV